MIEFYFVTNYTLCTFIAFGDTIVRCTTRNGADFSQRSFDLMVTLTFTTPSPDGNAATNDFFDLAIM